MSDLHQLFNDMQENRGILTGQDLGPPLIVPRWPVRKLIADGLLTIGSSCIIDEDVWICHYFKGSVFKPVKIGAGCTIRAGSVIYGDVEIGDNCNLGQHVVIREGCRIGHHSSIGTGVKVENNTRIGNYVSIETQSHITAHAEIGDYTFFGAMVITNNDFKMNYYREGHGGNLRGCIVGERVRVGSGAMLMAGVRIGDDAIINAGEVVRKDVPASTLYFTRRGGDIYKKITPDPIIDA